MAKAKAPKGASKKAYLASATQRLEQHRAKRIRRHIRRMAARPAHPKRGRTRMLRRQNMAQFKRDQLAARKDALAGTIKVNAPSLEMLRGRRDYAREGYGLLDDVGRAE